MFKKYIFPLLCISFFCNIALAETQIDSSQTDNNEVIPLSAPLQGNLKKTNIIKILEQHNKLFDDDQRLALYLQTPYEKRQYVFPMIHISPFISHKIKTHPEIIVWKNKKPTVIAHQLNEFSKKYLDDLSPFFYIYLDPDFWNPPQPEKNASSFLAYNNPYAIMGEKEADYVYPTLKQLFNLSNKNSEEYFKTDLVDDDILKISNVIADFENFKPYNTSVNSFSIQIIEAQRMQPYRSIGDPFKMYALAVKALGEEKSYDDFLKKHGFNSIAEFSQKADILIKAFKILKLNLNAAIEINHARYTKQTKELQESDFGTPDIDVMDMYIRLHQAKSGDIYFVKKNLEQLSNVFKTNFIDKGLMILVD